ncbi:MAG: hypothetical protein D3924_13180 [Candidatus Electrothrix sp. AR4]|nr:hypothetical protein [Candidatus Electrothrix sp. AR4]
MATVNQDVIAHLKSVLMQNKPVPMQEQYNGLIVALVVVEIKDRLCRRAYYSACWVINTQLWFARCIYMNQSLCH